MNYIEACVSGNVCLFKQWPLGDGVKATVIVAPEEIVDSFKSPAGLFRHYYPDGLKSKVAIVLKPEQTLFCEDESQYSRNGWEVLNV